MDKRSIKNGPSENFLDVIKKQFLTTEHHEIFFTETKFNSLVLTLWDGVDFAKPNWTRKHFLLMKMIDKQTSRYSRTI